MRGGRKQPLEDLRIEQPAAGTGSKAPRFFLQKVVEVEKEEAVVVTCARLQIKSTHSLEAAGGKGTTRKDHA